MSRLNRNAEANGRMGILLQAFSRFESAGLFMSGRGFRILSRFNGLTASA